MSKLIIQLVTPERSVLTEEVSSLSCPTTEGQITILPGHAPLISTLTSGELIAKNGENTHFIHVAGGFVQVQNGGKEIIILADAAEHYYEIDLARAEQAKLEAENILKEQTASDEEYALAATNLQRSLSRINIARKHSHRKTRITSEGVLKN
jgi:F-type H+-transporting ATPase subunit epsilon